MDPKTLPRLDEFTQLSLFITCELNRGKVLVIGGDITAVSCVAHRCLYKLRRGEVLSLFTLPIFTCLPLYHSSHVTILPLYHSSLFPFYLFTGISLYMLPFYHLTIPHSSHFYLFTTLPLYHFTTLPPYHLTTLPFYHLTTLPLYQVYRCGKQIHWLDAS